VKRLAMRAHRSARIWRARRKAPCDWNGVRILGYHRICDDPHPLSVAPDAFRAQMEALAASDATPISVPDAVALLRDGPVEGRYVCITFDDGYRDNLEAAVPVLRELGIPATIYVPTHVIDGPATFYWYDDPPPALSWAQCDALVAEGLVEVQAHTRTHPWLPQVDEERAREEIEGSRADLEARGYAVTSFCYPGGLFGPRDVQLVRDAGYAAAMTTAHGVNDGTGDPFTLRRTLIYWEDGPREFELKLAGALDDASVLRSLLGGVLARRMRAAATDV
jgi:peptidoglycan/xylan/chitin deacetylase (PgdA/CDA1 family)